MPFTYTYTARNQENPDRVMTFTIIDNHIKVNLTGFVDQLSEVLEEKERKEAIKDIISTQSGTALYKAVERLSGLVHINDVTPSYEDGQFKLTFWKRVAGLRFAPIILSMGSVDNPESASQFISTLVERQDQAESPGFFAGPLDYWASWIALLIGVVTLIKWPRKKKDNQQEA
jgi:hypothetical protein